MGKFKLVSSFGLTGDQSQAVEKITKWIKDEINIKCFWV